MTTNPPYRPPGGGSFVSPLSHSPFQPNPATNPFIGQASHAATSVVRQDQEHGTIPTPSRGPLSKSVRLGNVESIPGSPGGIPFDPSFQVQLLNLDLQLVDSEAADAWVHSPGSWILTWDTEVFTTDPVGTSAFPLIGEILLGNGGTSTIIQVSVNPGGSIAIPSGSIRFSVRWDTPIPPNDFQFFLPPDSVRVKAFVHRSFSAGDANRAFFLSADAGTDTVIPIPPHAIDFAGYGQTASGLFAALSFVEVLADTLTLVRLDGPVLENAMLNGIRFPIPGGATKVLVHLAGDASNIIDFKMGF